MLLAEVTTARLLAVEGVVGDELTHGDEVAQAEGLVELYVHALLSARHKEVGLKFLAQLLDFLKRRLKALLGASHAHIVPHDVAQLLVDGVHRAVAVYVHQVVEVGLHAFLGFLKLWEVGREAWHGDLVAQVVLDGVRQHEVSVGQTLHQCRCSQAVSAVVTEVALTNGEETLHRSLQLIIYPDATHSVVDSGINHHGVVVFHAVDLVGQLTGVDVGDFLIHVEEVAIALAHHVDAQAVDGLAEVEEHGLAGIVHAIALVAALLGGAAGHVARHEVAKGGIATLEVVVALLLGDVAALYLAVLQTLSVVDALRHPDAAVVAQRLAHEGELRLLVAVAWYAGGVYLHIGGVSKVGALAVASHGGAHVASHSVGREEIGVAIATGGDNHSMGGKALELAGDEVPGDDAACATVDNHHVVHLVAVVALHVAHLDLAVERRVGTQQQLLAGLALSIEGAAHLCATKGAVGQQATILSCEGHALCHALVYDIVRHLGQAIHVGLTGTIVATLDGVVEEAIHRVAVVLIVLGGVDTSLRSNRVGAAWRVLNAEVEHLEAHLAQCGGGAGASQSGTHHDDVEAALVGGVDEFLVRFIVSPFLSYWSLGDLRVNSRLSNVVVNVFFHLS